MVRAAGGDCDPYDVQAEATVGLQVGREGGATPQLASRQTASAPMDGLVSALVCVVLSSGVGDGERAAGPEPRGGQAGAARPHARPGHAAGTTFLPTYLPAGGSVWEAVLLSCSGLSSPNATNKPRAVLAILAVCGRRRVGCRRSSWPPTRRSLSSRRARSRPPSSSSHHHSGLPTAPLCRSVVVDTIASSPCRWLPCA